jgi:hypothetical protein
MSYKSATPPQPNRITKARPQKNYPPKKTVYKKLAVPPLAVLFTQLHVLLPKL